MPNHCSTQFCFTSSAADITRLYQQLVVTEPTDNSNDDETENNQIIDFNRVIPMPPSLNITCGGGGVRTLELLQLAPNRRIKNTQIFNKIDMEQLRTRAPCYGLNWDKLNAKQLIQLFDDNPAISQEFGLNMTLGRQYLANIKAFGYPHWYDWRVANWGTKWNAYAYQGGLSDDGTEFCGDFNTAWSPAEPVFTALAKSYPDVFMCIRYIDEGSLFAGTYESDGKGQLIDYACDSDEEIRHFAIEHFGWTYDDEETEEDVVPTPTDETSISTASAA